MRARLIAVVISVLVSLPACAAENKLSDQNYLNQFKDVFQRVERDYVQEPDKQKMIDAAINGMLMSLDPHSSYYTDEELDDFKNQTKGEFGGIGVEVVPENNVVKVISPIDDLPADKAGIKAGDYIIGVGDELVANIGFNKAIKEMRGNPGTKVRLLVISENDSKPRKVELVREIVKIKPVKANIEGENIAYVRIVSFNESTTSDLKKAFRTLETDAKKAGGIRGIILDLRNNPGGLLDQAVAVSEYFIDSGVVVSTKGRLESSAVTFSASKFAPKAPKVPMVVLINAGSASASEIVAGALQDYKRALIIGTKSFGKGSVQSFMQISPRTAVKMTTAKYYTPNGRSIQAEGIEPDITIEPAKVEFASKDEDAKRFSEASLKNYLKNDEKERGKAEDKDAPKVKTHESVPAEHDEKKEQKDKEKDEAKKSVAAPEMSDLYKKDYQFARSYDLIRALIITQTPQN